MTLLVAYLVAGADEIFRFFPHTSVSPQPVATGDMASRVSVGLVDLAGAMPAAFSAALAISVVHWAQVQAPGRRSHSNKFGVGFSAPVIAAIIVGLAMYGIAVAVLQMGIGRHPTVPSFGP